MTTEETVHEVAGAYTGSLTPLIIGFILLLAVKLIAGKVFLTKISKQQRRRPVSRK